MTLTNMEPEDSGEDSIDLTDVAEIVKKLLGAVVEDIHCGMLKPLDIVGLS